MFLRKYSFYSKHYTCWVCCLCSGFCSHSCSECRLFWVFEAMQLTPLFLIVIPSAFRFLCEMSFSSFAIAQLFEFFHFINTYPFYPLLLLSFNFGDFIDLMLLWSWCWFFIVWWITRPIHLQDVWCWFWASAVFLLKPYTFTLIFCTCLLTWYISNCRVFFWAKGLCWYQHPEQKPNHTTQDSLRILG